MAGYANERLELLDKLLKRRPELINGRLWTLDPKGLRFKHGETIAELKVPFHMGGVDEECVEKAVLSLLSLIMKRFEPTAGIDGRKDSTPLPLSTPILKDKTFRTDIFIADSLEKKLATEILSSTPYIDSSMLAAWFSSDGYGRKFIKWSSEIIEKTLKEEARTNGEEKTSYLALLAIVSTIRKKKEKIKNYRIKGITYEKADTAVGMAMYVTFKGALTDTLSRLRESGASCYNASSELLLTSSVVPKAFLSIPSILFSTSLNPYGINSETIELLSGLAPGIEEEYGDSTDFIKAAFEKIKGNQNITDPLKQQYEAVRFREEAIDYMTEFETPGIEAHDVLYEVYNEDRLIRNLLNDPKILERLSRSLDDVKKRYSKDQRRSEIINSFQRFLSTFKKSVLGGFLRSVKGEPDAIVPVLESYYAYRLDDHIDRSSALMRSYLVDRRDEFNQNTLMEEYNRGRLYRFSVDDRPILKSLELEEEGQLFVDMKDFTRKTLKVKEIAMAEFMKEYFYKPILTAAGQYGMGTGVAADERGIRLTNMPGDAAIFSGGVTYLVSLARDIQNVIRRYREQLLKRLPPRKDEEVLDEVHRHFEERKKFLKEKRNELNKALERNEPGVESKLVALGEEEHRLENIYRDELAEAIKGELEAGLYISYGAKAETMVIEPKAEFSPPVKVAIGEKINESARGTFRNPLVRAKLEVLLENEKQKRKQKVQYPFDVYIDTIISIKMPPELDSAFEKLISTRKPSSAQAMAKIMANEYFNDLKNIISGASFSELRLITATTDIYNKGQALSIHALNAYMKETRGTKWFFSKTIPVNGLDESIQEAFFFPSAQLEFWFGYETVKGTDQIEIFCKSGEVIFKGFEANTPIVIYEMINSEGDFFKLLVKHHFHGWLEESKKPAAEAEPAI